MTLADLLMLFGACVAVAFFLIAGAVWWLSRIARREFSDSELRAVIDFDLATAAAEQPPIERAEPATAKPSRPAKKKQAKPDTATLSALLESLEDSFRTMSIPAIRGSWLPKKDIQALYKLGVYVCPDWEMDITKPVRLSSARSLPAIASAHMFAKKYDTETHMHPRFVFAIKAPMLPPAVEQIAGTAYRFGMCFEGNAERQGTGSAPRLLWVWAWVVVTGDGSVRVPNEIRTVQNTIIHRRSSACRSRVERVSNRLRVAQSIATRDDMAVEDSTALLACQFRRLIDWWTSREDRWSVGVRKDGHRVTFSIDPKHTSAFFADRGRQATSNGKTRPIIHYVEEHTRSNGSVVKAHVRGLSNFEWRGYRCAVTAPLMRGRVFTTCSLSPVVVDDKETPSESHLPPERFASILADAEDEPLQPA